MRTKLTFLFSFLLLIGSLNAQDRKVLVEKFTSASCGNCPNGNVILDSLTENYDNIIWVSHHNGWIADAMGNPDSEIIAPELTVFAPSITVNRVHFPEATYVAFGSSLWREKILEQLAEPPKTSIELEGTYDPNSRTINLNVTTVFSENPNPPFFPEYRFNVFVVEDDVVGSGSGYDQANYDNNDANSPLYGLGNPILNYSHHGVVRNILNNPWGDLGMIPTNPVPGAMYSMDYSYEIPVEYDETKMRIVAFVSFFDENDVDNRSVLNADEIQVSDLSIQTANINLNKADFDFKIFPIPASDVLNLEVLSDEAQEAEVRLYNLVGRTILNRKMNLETGRNHFEYNLDQLAAGTYFIEMKGEDHQLVRKLIIQK